MAHQHHLYHRGILCVPKGTNVEFVVVKATHALLDPFFVLTWIYGEYTTVISSGIYHIGRDQLPWYMQPWPFGIHLSHDRWNRKNYFILRQKRHVSGYVRAWLKLIRVGGMKRVVLTNYFWYCTRLVHKRCVTSFMKRSGSVDWIRPSWYCSSIATGQIIININVQ